MRKYYVENERVWQALREVAKNLLEFTKLREQGNVIPKYPNLQGGGLFTIWDDTDKKAEIIVHGVDESELRDVISFCNSYEYRPWNMFGRGLGLDVDVTYLMPYVVLCNDKEYKSKICDRIVKFN